MPASSKEQKKLKRTKIPQENIIRPRLQREIGSRCPFCPNEDVSHFEIHHIDEDRNNHTYENLLLLCQVCHSRFTKKEWDLRKGRDKKDEILKIAKFRLLESNPIDSFDYECFSMQQENGRIPEQTSNGSKVNVIVLDQFNLQITLKQSDGRIWKGDLLLRTRNYGELFFIYQDNTEIEVGRTECYIMQSFAGGDRVDKLFLKPLTDQKDYQDELFIRTSRNNIV
jgi:hypothetical protein